MIACHRCLGFEGGAGIRAMIVGLGSGVGIGITYADAKRDFEQLSPPKPEPEVKKEES